jgi:hypothetical protein
MSHDGYESIELNSIDIDINAKDDIEKKILGLLEYIII